jgi:hypothetical protein
MLDVIAVDMTTHKVTVLAENKTERNADAIESMAILRRGVDETFYVTVPHGRYKDGDEWCANEDV